MTVLAGAPVVVGIDGSECSALALTLATRLAADRDRPLRAVHAFVWPLVHVPLGPSPQGPAAGGLANEADRIVAEAVAVATKASPGLRVTGEVMVGAPTAVLLGESQQAVIVVLGDRGLGGFTGLLVGSVAVQLAAHAACPVIVARGELSHDGDVLVGVDGSEAGQKALGFAFEEASLRGVGLTALHAFTHPVSTGPGDILPLIYDPDLLAQEEEALLAEALGGWSERYPDVAVRRVLVREPAAKALIHAAEQASMVVVGSRGRGGFAGLLLGSVSQVVLHHSSRPVAIVR